MSDLFPCGFSVEELKRNILDKSVRLLNGLKMWEIGELYAQVSTRLQDD